MRDHTPDALVKARRLRSAMSLPEVLLWRELRLRVGTAKFRRQHPIGPYIVDFFCARSRLVVEIDGKAHDMGERAKRDEKRNDWLTLQNLRLIRVPAADVLRNAATVADSLVAVCVASPPPSALRAATSPDGGGF